MGTDRGGKIWERGEKGKKEREKRKETLEGEGRAKEGKTMEKGRERKDRERGGMGGKTGTAGRKRRNEEEESPVNSQKQQFLTTFSTLGFLRSGLTLVYKWGPWCTLPNQILS